MKKKLITLLPYLIALAIDFYLLPFLARSTGAAMLLMLCVMPFIALISAILYGVRHGFCLILPLAALVLFIPTLFIHYNLSAWVYAVAYAVIVLAGNGIGRLFYGKK